jgi:DNA-binding GntR family transcriptional regulator
MPTAGERVYRLIRDSIMDGRLAPGDRITEEELGELCGTSRTPVREALGRLSSEGLVNLSPNHGAQVTTVWTDELEQIYRLRAMVESYAAERAAIRVNDERIARLKRLATIMETAVREGYEPINEKFTPANAEFHQIIFDAADSKRLVSLAASVTEMPLVLRALKTYTFEEKVRSALQHHELVAAFEVRDASWASATMRAHVLGAYWALVRSRGADGQSPGGVTAVAD